MKISLIQFKEIAIFTNFYHIFPRYFFSTDIDVSWVLDAKKPRNPRLFFLNEEGKNIRNSSMRLSRGKKECRTERVYIAVSSLAVIIKHSNLKEIKT